MNGDVFSLHFGEAFHETLEPLKVKVTFLEIKDGPSVPLFCAPFLSGMACDALIS